jgi:3-hydroxyisobutyrate dehydrogenase
VITALTFYGSYSTQFCAPFAHKQLQRRPNQQANISNYVLSSAMATNQGSYPNPIHPSRTRIGWIGPGIMGAAMAGRIQAAGYSLTIYARTPSKASALLCSGASLASSPASLASQSDIIFSMVGNPRDVRSVLLDQVSGAISALSRLGVDRLHHQ